MGQKKADHAGHAGTGHVETHRERLQEEAEEADVLFGVGAVRLGSVDLGGETETRPESLSRARGLDDRESAGSRHGAFEFVIYGLSEASRHTSWTGCVRNALDQPWTRLG